MPLVSRTRATLRSAEFGFFGVVVYTRVHTPRRWGEPFSAGVLVFSTLSSRPLRTSWLIVGMGGLDLLPALGRAVDGGAAVRARCPGPESARGAPSGPRVRACRPPQEPASWSEPDSSPLATRHHHSPPDRWAWPPAPAVCRTPRCTANGSRPKSPWARLTTIPGHPDPVKAGVRCLRGHRVSRLVPHNHGVARVIPDPASAPCDLAYGMGRWHRCPATATRRQPGGLLRMPGGDRPGPFRRECSAG